MIRLIFLSVSQLALISQLQERAKLSTFEYENKASRESNNHIKRLNWSSFKKDTLTLLDWGGGGGQHASQGSDSNAYLGEYI